MHITRKVTDDLYWVGANDHRLALFENAYPIPRGVSYNAYLLLDEKTVLFDTVDWSGCRQLLENLDYLLADRPLDYLVIMTSGLGLLFAANMSAVIPSPPLALGSAPALSREIGRASCRERV